jgi:hypothetical protein
MANQQRGIDQSRKPIEKSRGAIFYKQEARYMFVTLLIDLQTTDKPSTIRVLWMISTGRANYEAIHEH